MRHSWSVGAKCIGHESLMYPWPGSKVGEDAAKAICEGCPCKAPCLEYALVHEREWGIWGGLNPDERRKILWHRENAG